MEDYKGTNSVSESSHRNFPKMPNLETFQHTIPCIFEPDSTQVVHLGNLFWSQLSHLESCINSRDMFEE